MFRYQLETPGEELCKLLYDRSVVDEVWDRLENKHLIVTGRAEEFRLFFQEALALNMTRRLFLTADALQSEIEPTDSSFLSLLESKVDFLGFQRLKGNGELLRTVRRSLIAGNHKIGETLRKHLSRKAEDENARCYLCGSLMDFTDKTSMHFMTLDHVWPQSHGGDSIAENLLPACMICNSTKKRDYASWASLGVHTVILGFKPSGEAMKSIDGTARFALQSLAARKLANEKRCSLKQAYIRLGPWCAEPWLANDEELGDFFNLGIHERK